MITPREMHQLFHTISSMHTLNINGVDFIDKVAVFKIIGGYCDDNPDVTFERDGDKTIWHLKWPIPLTQEVVETKDTSKEE